MRCFLFYIVVLTPCAISDLQALKATSLEKSVYLPRETDAWATCENEKAAREAAEGELRKECEISAELQ